MPPMSRLRVSDNPPEALVGRRLFDFALAAYATPAFLDRLPPDPDPGTFEWIGWESEALHKRMIQLHFPAAPARHRTDNLLAARALVGQGLGASVFPCYWADPDPGLVRLYPKPVPSNRHGLWVLAHPDARRTARVRAFTDFITEVFLADKALFEGQRV